MPAENYFEKVQKGGREVKFFCETLGNEGAKQIAMALMDPDTKVQSLVIHSCGIGGESATVIAKALKNSPSLQVLWRPLSNNNTGVDGTKDVAEACKEALKIRSTLQDLSLCCNDLGDVDAMGIAEALKTNSSSLQSLNLSFNKIGVEGATAIAEALKINSTLQLLNLSENNIGGKGATALAKALKQALLPSHPIIQGVELVDYKVRILDPQSATNAATRVMIEFRNGDTTWTTVSVDRNIISASVNALVDGYEYALIEHAESCMVR